MRGSALDVAAGFLLAATLIAQDRAIPFWPDEVPAAIHAEVDGVAALETVRELGRFHRVHGSPGLDSDILRFEAFNLVDGKRSVSEVRDILAGRYGAAPLPEVAAYFDMLAKAGAVRFSP